jgi:hypothetical protein
MNLTDQSRIIKDPMNIEEIKVPVMPILILLANGIIGEAKSLRGATALVIGNEYYDAEDKEDDWHYRVAHARHEAMKALAAGLNIKVMDKNLGEIKNNYAAAEDDPDYEEDIQKKTSMSISVENEKAFLLSLAQIGTIRIMERDDSCIFDKNIEQNCKCEDCMLKIQDELGYIHCNVYDELKTELESCSSGTTGSINEYVGGNYRIVQS